MTYKEKWRMNQRDRDLEREELKDEAKNQLIELLTSQVVDLSMMSKIELGDDVIAEINRLQTIIDKNNG